MYGHKIISKLRQKKYRQEYGCFVVEGKRAVQDTLDSKAKVLQLVVSNEFVRSQAEFCRLPAVTKFFNKNLVLQLRESDLSPLLDSTTPQGIAAVVEMPQTALSDLEDAHLLAVYEDIRDPGNLGTMIRTADWFGVDGIILIGGTDPYQPKVVRSSMGSLFQIPVVTLSSHQGLSALQQLQKSGVKVVVTRPELDQKQTAKMSLPKLERMAVVFGNEAHGTSDNVDTLADEAVTIPRFGQAESLNVAVSCGIVFFALSQVK